MNVMKNNDYDYDDEYDDYIPTSKQNTIGNKTVGLAFLVTGMVIACALFAVYIANKGSAPRKNNVSADYAGLEVYKEDDIDNYISGSTLRAEDLDIWDTKPVGEVMASPIPVSGNIIEDETAPEEETPGDNKLLINYSDGTSEYVDINPYLERNEYAASNFVYKKPFLYYYKNNHQVSYVGVDISKVEDYVDFDELKKAGVDYCMIRLGQRGYYSGELSVDDNFFDNIERAHRAGLDVGVYFVSAATNKDEAVEEAEFVIDSISENSIEYPVAYYEEDIPGQDTRTDSMTQMQRTNVAMAFMDRIEEAGYCPCLYGNTEWLIKKYSIGSLEGYDIWLSEYADVPEYPYRFAMWQYDDSGSVSGISGCANLNICFTDYSVK